MYIYENFSTFFFLGLVFFLLYKIFWESKRKEGLLLSPFIDTSAPNAYCHLKGKVYTKVSRLKKIFSETEIRVLKIDNFEKYTKFRKMTSIFRKALDNLEIFVDPDKLFEMMLLVSPMGGGKTVTYDSLLAQIGWYDRAIINEEKAGDFTSKHHKKRRDIILCPYDERAHVWNLIEEPLPIIQAALENFMAASLNGEKGDNHFTASAKRFYTDIARLTTELLTTEEKWNCFLNEYKKFQKYAEESDSKSLQDCAKTMEHVYPVFSLMHFQIVHQKKKSFTIEDFFKKKGGAKLFMVKNDLYSTELRLLFSAFYGAFINTHMAKPEYTKTKSRTFYAFDEYPSINLTMETRKKLHTKIRSKGGAVVIGCHYIDNDTEIQDLMTSTVYAYMIFSIKNQRTQEWLEKTVVGEREFKVIEKKKDGTYDERVKKDTLIDWEDMDKMKKDFQHLTVIKEENALYVGKSDFIDLPEKCKPFVTADLTDYNLMLNKEYKEKMDKLQANKSAVEKYKKKAG